MASFMGVAPSRPMEATTWTRTEATAAPRKAIHTKSPSSETPKTERPTTIAKLAPALMPRMPGSASGLRVSPCRTAPASASAAPTARPSRVRSTRASEMLCSGWEASQIAESGDRLGAHDHRQRARQRHRPHEEDGDDGRAEPTRSPGDAGLLVVLEDGCAGHEPLTASAILGSVTSTMFGIDSGVGLVLAITIALSGSA